MHAMRARVPITNISVMVYCHCRVIFMEVASDAAQLCECPMTTVMTTTAKPFVANGADTPSFRRYGQCDPDERICVKKGYTHEQKTYPARVLTMTKYNDPSHVFT